MLIVTKVLGFPIYLTICRYKGRGDEQAFYVITAVLKPHFGKVQPDKIAQEI